ncbi:MAG: hypothetical protein AAF566_02830 [Pseudomonadota bacterium]
MLRGKRLTTAAVSVAIALGVGHVTQYGFGIGSSASDAFQQPVPRPFRVADAGAGFFFNPLLPTEEAGSEIPTAPDVVAGPVSLPAGSLEPLSVPEDLSDLSGSGTRLRAEALGTICKVTAHAAAAAGAVIRVDLDACERDVPVSLAHAGLVFTEVTGPDGRLMADIPAFEADAEIRVSVAGQTAITLSVPVPDAVWYDRVALLWDGSVPLSIHALEPGARPGGTGHVWAEHPHSPARAEAAEGGYLMTLGDPSVGEPALAEVYSFPSRRISGDGTVALSVSASVTEASCGRDVPVRILQVESGATARDTMFSVAFPGCDAVGQYLVLKNLLEDLKVAQN